MTSVRTAAWSLESCSIFEDYKYSMNTYKNCVVMANNGFSFYNLAWITRKRISEI